MTTTPITVTIRTSGLELTAPLELVLAAGWTVTTDCDAISVDDRSSNGFVSRRLYRTLSERGEFPQGKVPLQSGLHILARCVELGEIESLDRKRDNARLEIAKLEADAARNRKMTAEFELSARTK